jgi:hypothetical protein
VPEVLYFKDLPSIMVEFQIEPFLEEYIPGSIVLCRDMIDGKEVFFQIPRPIVQSMDQDKLDELKGAVHTWWLARKDLG